MKFPSTEFDAAVAGLCHGTVSDEVLEELHELLRVDSNARDEYLWRVEVHSELATAKMESACYSSLEESASESVVTTTMVSTRSPAGRREYGSRRTGVALAALLLLGVGLRWWTAAPSSTDAPEVIAHFTELSSCRWMDEGALFQVGEAVREGQRIELSAGSAQIRFLSGTDVELIGPTIFEATTPKSAFLLLGRASLVAESPDSKGFTLVTQSSKFVDIGTAFTALAAPDGLSRVDVTEGVVDVVLDGVESSRRLRAGDSLCIEPGERKILTRIERGDGTAAFRFPTIDPPSADDYADRACGHASIRVVRGQLETRVGTFDPSSVLIDGAGQSHQDAPRESAFFAENSGGSLLLDLGRVITVSKVNTYSWHQHRRVESHRHRARQSFTLYGYSGDQLPDLDRSPSTTGWTRIARVNSDEFFQVDEPLDRPAQQACSITAARGGIGRFRYLLWKVNNRTFYGEFDVFGSESAE